METDREGAFQEVPVLKRVWWPVCHHIFLSSTALSIKFSGYGFLGISKDKAMFGRADAQQVPALFWCELLGVLLVIC